MTSHEAISFTSAAYSLVTGSVEMWTSTSAVLLSLTFLTLLAYMWITCYWPTSFECLRDESCPLPLPPGSMGYPVIGESFEFARKGSDFHAERLATFGKVYKTYLFGMPMVRVVGGEHVKPVLLGEHSSVSAFVPCSIQRMVGAFSLQNLSPDDHRIIKKMTSNLFTTNALAAFVPRIQMTIDRNLEHWCQVSGDQGNFLGFPACQNLVHDLMLEIVLGVGLRQSEKDGLGTAMKTFCNNIFAWPICFPGGGLWKGLKARERIMKEVRKKLGRAEPRHDADFLCIVEMMQQQAELAKDHNILEDNTMEILFGSYSTMSSALNSALLSLGQHPEILSKLEEELERHGLLEDRNKKLTYEVISKLQYISSFNKEVLRLYPPVGAGFRRVNKTLQIGGYQIPKGWNVVYSIRETQQVSDLFSNSDIFSPDRWLTTDRDELREKARYQFIPFGLGARACLGRHLAVLYQAVFLIQVVRRCRFRLKNPHPRMQFIPIPRPNDDLPVTFQRWTDHSVLSDSC